MEGKLLKPWETAMAANLNLDQQKLDSKLRDAIRLGNENLVVSLLADGAKPSIADRDGGTSLHWAAFYAGIHCSSEVVQALLAAGADPNVKDRLGLTPLHYAADREHVASIQLLLAAGADPNAASDCGGDSPLHVAAERLREDVVEALHSAGADLDARNGKGLLPEDLASGKVKGCFAARRASLEERDLLACSAPATAKSRSSAL